MARDLWQIRRQKRMTIDELARTASIHPGLIKAYELGERSIAMRDLEKLAAALEVEAWEIKELSDPPPRGPSRSSAPPRYGGDYSRPPYESNTGYSRFGSDLNSSRYSSDNRRSDYGGSSYGRSDYRSSRPPSRYGNDQERRPSRSSYGSSDRSTSRPRKKTGPRRRQPTAPARPSQIEHLKGLLIRLDMSGDDLLRLAGKPLSMLSRKEAAQLLTTCQTMLAERKPPRPKGKRRRPYLPESVDEHELVYLTEVQVSKRDMHLTLFNGDNLQGKLLGFSPYALTLSKDDGQEVTVAKLAIAYYEVEPAADGEDPAEEESE